MRRHNSNLGAFYDFGKEDGGTQSSELRRPSYSVKKRGQIRRQKTNGFEKNTARLWARDLPTTAF